MSEIDDLPIAAFRAFLGSDGFAYPREQLAAALIAARHPPQKLAEEKGGRWITIGAKTDEETGKRRGGSRVFIQNGRITKGNPNLTGRKIGSLKEEPEHGTHRQQLKQGRGYDQAKLLKAAKGEGIDKASVLSLAGQIREHHNAFATERNEMLKQARSSLGGQAKILKQNIDTGKIEGADQVKGIDDVAAQLADQYPHLFSGREDPGEQLYEMLAAGNSEEMGDQQALEEALEQIRSETAGRENPEADDQAAGDVGDFNPGELEPEPAKPQRIKTTLGGDEGDLDLPDFQPNMFLPGVGEHVGTQGHLFGKPERREAQRTLHPDQGALPFAEVALAGKDGQKASTLLRKAKADGRAVLAYVTRLALRRALANGGRGLLRRKALFTPSEHHYLTEAMAATTATGELLGRARIRLRQQRARQFAESDHDDEAPPFERFDEGDPVQLFEPERAVEYFQGLVPSLDLDPERFGWEHRRAAFTMANRTDRTLLGRIKAIISDALKSGAELSNAPATIDRVLSAAGVSPRNPQYAEMVFRTNMMDAYNTGSEQERMRPDLIDDFPVWRYLGIEDGRQGSDHEVNFDKYYPASVSFADVRDAHILKGGEVIESRGKGRPYNCRCTPQPISRWQWAKLKRGGARIADGYPDVPIAA